MYKQNPRSPVAKALKGNQNKLPQGLKGAIASAPESPAKANMNPGVQTDASKTKTAPAGGFKGSAKMDAAMGGPTGTTGSTDKTSTGTTGSTDKKKTTTPSADGRYGGPSTPKKNTSTGKTGTTGTTGTPPKKKPAYDKELNGLVASRKGLKKGTNEYNKVQNQINAKLGSSTRHTVETAKKPTATSTDLKKKDISLKTSTTGKPATVKPAKTKTLISGESRNPVGKLNLADAPVTPKLVKNTAPAKKPAAKKTVGQKIKGKVNKVRLARLDRVAKRQAKKESTNTRNKFDGLGK